MYSVLIIDDDDQLRLSFEKLLTEEGYLVKSAMSGEIGIKLCKKEKFDLVILDMRLPGINGLKTFRFIHEIKPKLPVIMMTAYSTTATAIEAIKAGAFDYILKPFNIPEMLKIIKQAIEVGIFMRTPIQMNVEPDDFSNEIIIGKCRSMQEVYKAIGRVSATDATVLIRGDSGTGKELVARAIYQYSNRSTKVFSTINSVAIPENLLESELFGYEKGAFTGAAFQRIGKIEKANGGTIFLDEIGDLSMNLQSKIMRLIQEKTIERLGGQEIIAMDVRIITATNKNLEKAITENKFREDLYYRLKVVTINLPPLCKREKDIPLLSKYFSAKFAAELGIKNPGITDAAMLLLEKYSWPGNIRELSNVIQKTLVFNRGAPLSSKEISGALNINKQQKDNALNLFNKNICEYVRMLLMSELEVGEGNIYDSCIDRFAAIIISEALNITEGNRTEAAKLLGMSRPTLHAKIKKHNIQIDTSATLDPI